MSAPRALTLAAILSASLAHADPGWLSAQGRIAEKSEVAAFVGPRSFGVGLLRADKDDPTRGLAFEASWLLQDRVLEATGTRRWRLGAPGKATFSGTAALTGFVVPSSELDLGLGPSVGLNVGLGGRAVSFEIGALSGVDLFARGSSRFTERLQLGVRVEVGRFSLRLCGRAGVDLIPGRNFILRADAILSVGLLRG